MAATLFYEDQAREWSTATGTGNLTLNGAVPGYTSFFEAYSTTQIFEYLIKGEAIDGASLSYEVGIGQMIDASTMQRISVRSSTNGDTFVNFDGGTKEISGWLSGPKTTEIVKQIVRVQVRNESGSTLSKLAAVTTSGFNTTEGLPLAILADKDAGSTRPALGLVEADISNNSNGYIVHSGEIRDANTSGWSERDILMLGDAGGLVTTAPSAGHLQYIGYVVRSHASAGILMVGNTTIPNVLALAGGTMTGTLNMGAQMLSNIKRHDMGTVFDAGNKTGASQNIDWTNGNFQKCTLTGNVSSSTFTAPNGHTHGLCLLIFQDGTGNRTFSWPGSVIWDRTTTPTLTTTASTADMACGTWDGTSYRFSFFKGSA